jgi:hypothetical protein
LLRSSTEAAKGLVVRRPLASDTVVAAAKAAASSHHPRAMSLHWKDDADRMEGPLLFLRIIRY